MSLKRIVLTGGGTAGHVTANLALLPKLREEGCEIHYIGSVDGIEKKLALEAGLHYDGVQTGKFRRYRDLKNLTDPFRVIQGFFQSRKLLKAWRPDVVFSKGGFVSVPVVWAAASLNIPVVSHESDMTPGLANKLTIRSARKICYTFPETEKQLPKGKAVWTGSPIREELLQGSKEAGRELTGFTEEKPVLMMIGGSLGSVAVNEAVRKDLSRFLEKFQIIHVCGKGNLREDLLSTEGYRQYEYISDGLRDLYALADIVISRAGSNVINELRALKKPNILIPLPLSASRGDQILNAASFEKQGFSHVLEQERVEAEEGLLLKTVEEVYQMRMQYITAMEKNDAVNGVEGVVKVLREATTS